MAISIDWLLEITDDFIDGNATEEYDCRDTTQGAAAVSSFFKIENSDFFP